MRTRPSPDRSSSAVTRFATAALLALTLLTTHAVRPSGASVSPVPVPLPAGSEGGALRGVTCPAPTRCWAVGWSGGATGMRRLALRWGGSRWSVSPTPPPTAVGDEGTLDSLDAVACRYSTTCWAVGATGGWSTHWGIRFPLMLRRDGTPWTVAPQPELPPLPPGTGRTMGILTGITCSEPTTCWAVGYSYAFPGRRRRVVLRQRGSSWSVIPTPLPAGTRDSELRAVTCSAADECWAVGRFEGTHGAGRLVLRWDGTRWSVVRTPLPVGNLDSALYGVTCISRAECWALGEYTGAHSAGPGRLVLRWNGAGWIVVAAPVPTDARESSLESMACRNRETCWAVGHAGRRPLVMRRTGTSWSVVPNPAGAAPAALHSTACFRDGCWAVGDSGEGHLRPFAVRLE